MYTKEEFAQSLKRRGYTRHISDARRYADQTGKEQFEEEDFQDAWRALNPEPMGRIYNHDTIDGVEIWFRVRR